MSPRPLSIAIVCLLLLPLTLLAQSRVFISENGVCEINGKKIFGISVAVLPPPDAKTPEGKSAWQEYAGAGVNLARIVPSVSGESYGWTDKGYAVARQYLDALASARIYAWLWLGDDIAHFTEKDKEKQEKLRKLIETFKGHSALAFWKGEDEPLWGEMNAKEPGTKAPSTLALPYKMIRELDPHHPVVVIQAPRGTVKQLAAYRDVLDITGVDVFPISYPPGRHLDKWPNHDISSVGDWTKILMEAAGGKPVWVTLQISFSGTATPGKTLRMPTFTQERFMTYQAIINGARAVNYFGGGNKLSLNERDAALGWNWTFWQRVLRPLLEEINDKSPLAGALVAPDSKVAVKAKSGEGIEVLTRQTDDGVYVLACSREPQKTQEVEFTGLPVGLNEAKVLYESPRKIISKDASFKDWFAPYDVHVYHFARSK